MTPAASACGVRTRDWILQHEQRGRDVADAIVVVLLEAAFEQRTDRRRERRRQRVPGRVALEDRRQRVADVVALNAACR